MSEYVNHIGIAITCPLCQCSPCQCAPRYPRTCTPPTPAPEVLSEEELSLMERLQATGIRTGTTHWGRCWQDHLPCAIGKLIAAYRTMADANQRLYKENDLLRCNVNALRQARIAYKTLETERDQLKGQVEGMKRTLPSFDFASSEIVDYLDSEVSSLFPSLGVESAYVTDMSRGSDFPGSGDPKHVWKLAIDKLRADLHAARETAARYRKALVGMMKQREANCGDGLLDDASCFDEAEKALADHLVDANKMALADENQRLKRQVDILLAHK